MGGTIPKEEIEREERIRHSNNERDLEWLERLIRDFLSNPTKENKEKLREAVFPKREEREESCPSWNKKGFTK